MNIRNTVHTLAAAALLAVTVVSVSAGQADAKPRGPRDTDRPVSRDPNHPGNLCAIQGNAVGQPQHDWVFYLPGDWITVGGAEYFCDFGRWVNPYA